MRLASLLVIVCTAALGQSGRLELQKRQSIAFMSAVAVGQPSGSPNNSSIFQIRLVRDHASADAEEMPWKSRDGQTVPLPVEKTAVFDDAGVASASRSQR